MAEEHRPGKGCFFYGCLTFIVILVAVGFGTYFGTRKAVRMAVDKYLDTQPGKLPTVQISYPDRRATLDRFEKSLDSADDGQAVPPIELTTDELNVTLRETGVLGPLRDQVFFRIETNQLKAEVSIPLDQFEIWRQLGSKLMLGGLKGRYLNGTAFLNPQVTNGVLDLKVTDVYVKGEPLPGSFMGNIRSENLAAGANKNAEAQNILKHVEKVEVKDNKLYLHLEQPGN